MDRQSGQRHGRSAPWVISSFCPLPLQQSGLRPSSVSAGPGCESQNTVKYLPTAQVPYGDDTEVPRYLLIIRITKNLSSC